MPLEREPLTIMNVVTHVIESQRPLANSKDIQLQYQIPVDLPHAYADNDLIERVLQNLIGNALKFTPLGGEVFVSAGIENSDENEIFVRVQDTGPGIPASVKDRLFQKFTTGKQIGSGSGLGLAFCKMVVEAHDGRIWAKSWPDEGATFTFTLPISSIYAAKPSPNSGLTLFPVHKKYKL
jgi:signal transduction histidine kinase